MLVSMIGSVAFFKFLRKADIDWFSGDWFKFLSESLHVGLLSLSPPLLLQKIDINPELWFRGKMQCVMCGLGACHGFEPYHR